MRGPLPGDGAARTKRKTSEPGVIGRTGEQRGASRELLVLLPTGTSDDVGWVVNRSRDPRYANQQCPEH